MPKLDTSKIVRDAVRKALEQVGAKAATRTRTEKTGTVTFSDLNSAQQAVVVMAAGLQSKKSRMPSHAEIEHFGGKNCRDADAVAGVMKAQRAILSGALPEHVDGLAVKPNNVNEKDDPNGDADGRRSRIGRR